MPTFQGQINSKLPPVGATIFTVMSRLAQEHNAINLSQGFPDFDCTQELRFCFAKSDETLKRGAEILCGI